MNERMKKLAICLRAGPCRSAAGEPRLRAAAAHHHLGRHRPDSDRRRAVRARRARRRRPRRGAGRAARSGEQRPLQGHGARRHGRHADHRGRGRCRRAGSSCATTTWSWARSRRSRDGEVAVDFELVNVLTGQRMLRPEVDREARQPAQRARIASPMRSTRRSSASAARSPRASPTCRWTASRRTSTTSSSSRMPTARTRA